jgi:hypothetical protein
MENIMNLRIFIKLLAGIFLVIFMADCQSYRVIQSDDSSAAIEGGRRRTETEARMAAMEGAKEHFQGAEVVETKEPDCDEEIRGKARATSSSTASIKLKSYYRCIVFVKKK